MRRVLRALLCPIMSLIDSDYASPASAQMVQYCLSDLEAHAEALQPCRERSAQIVQHQPETPEAMSSANFAFDHPLNGVPRSPGKTSASSARWCAPWTSPGLSDGRACRSSRAGWLNGTRCGIPFLVRVAGIVQVAKSSESSAHVIPATSSRRWPVSINRRTKAPKG